MPDQIPVHPTEENGVSSSWFLPSGGTVNQDLGGIHADIPVAPLSFDEAEFVGRVLLSAAARGREQSERVLAARAAGRERFIELFTEECGEPETSGDDLVWTRGDRRIVLSGNDAVLDDDRRILVNSEATALTVKTLFSLKTLDDQEN